VRAGPLVLPAKLLDVLPQISAPLSAIWGTHDRPHPDPLLQERVLRQFHPDLQFRIIPEAGHWVMYERPTQFNRALLELLALPLTTGDLHVPAEKNREVAIRFITTMGEHGGIDEKLITDDFEWWASYHHGVMNCAQIKAMVKSLTLMPRLPEMNVIGVTADGDRVAIEAAGKCTLADGRPYNNSYHFVVLFRDGKVRMVREYCDTQLAANTFAVASLADVTRNSSGTTATH
jgi:ketosteroid isomerase-like protein